ncbi:RidA family protein [bacterium]|nr:RidA family protein [bacterium]
MSKRCINAAKAPAAIGPYSHAVAAGDLVFLSGQLGADPASGTLVPGGIEAETRQALANIASVLAELGLTVADVVKTTVFLRDMGEFARMNAVYAETFASEYPARSTFQVAALPKGGAVEIEVIASSCRAAADAVATRRVGD